jgi:hypothetical protein
MKYSEKLKDPRWQKKRLQILERDTCTRRACRAKDKTLNVHHIFYLSGTEPWDIPDGLLITFCCDCHNPGPCEDKYKTCNDCPEYKKDCIGQATHPHDIAVMIADLLNLLWTNADQFGGRDYHNIIYNAVYMLKPE